MLVNGDTEVEPDETFTVFLIENSNPFTQALGTIVTDDFDIPVNAAPSFTKGAEQTVLEDAGSVTVAGWATAISAGPVSEAGQTLTFNVTVNTNAPLFASGPSIDATSGDLTFTPADDANGTATITVTLSDDGGIANSGVDESAAQQFTIAVTAVNDAPSFAKGADQTVLEDVGAVTVAGWATAISAGPADESGQVLTFDVTANSNPSLFASGPSIDGTSGDLTYTPADDANGTATITVRLADDGGIADGGADTSGEQTFVVNVTAVNDVPVFALVDDPAVDEDSGPQTVTEFASGISAGPADEAGQILGFAVVNDNPSLFSAPPSIDPVTGDLTYTSALNANGTAAITVTLADDGGTANGGIDTSPTESFTITVYPVNDPPVAHAGPNQLLECAGALTVAVIDGSQSFDVDGDVLTFQWVLVGPPVVVLGAGGNPAIAVGFGVNTVQLEVSDNEYSDTDDLVVEIEDTTDPVLTVVGDDPLLLELGTLYADPGATAADICDGDLTAAIGVNSTGVDPTAEGLYTVSYSVSDGAGNPASASRAVQVVVTPNSYVLISTNSMALKEANVNSGFVGVTDFGEKPFLKHRVELSLEKTFTAESSRVSAPRVHVGNKVTIAGTLVYTELVKEHKKAEIATKQQVGSGHWPLFSVFGLPVFETGVPGSEKIEVRKKKKDDSIVELVPGAYGVIKVKKNGTLVFTGGVYEIQSLKAEHETQVYFEAATTLLVAGTVEIGEKSYFGPAPEATIDASDILVYVEGLARDDGRSGDGKSKDGNSKDGNSKDGDSKDGDSRDRAPRNRTVVDVGGKVIFKGNVYANGTVDLHHKTTFTGSVIGQNVDVEHDVDLFLQSGWKTPGAVYDPPPVVVAAKRLAAGKVGGVPEEARDSVLNYPNPFNATTQIAYHLAQSGEVSLVVYNMMGQVVRVLVREHQLAGFHQMEWNGRDDGGRSVASGLYLYRFASGEVVRTNRMIMLK